MPLRLSVAAAVGCLAALAGLLGACSSAVDQPAASLNSPSTTMNTTTASTGDVSGYQLSEKELKMDCKSLTGSMRVRIAQLKAEKPSSGSTGVSQGMQTVATKIWGGPERGNSSSSDRSRDRAQVYAYNRRLAEKKCPTVNLATELPGA